MNCPLLFPCPSKKAAPLLQNAGGEGGIRTLDTGFSPYLAARISACGRIGTPSTWTRLEIFSAPLRILY